MTNSELILSCTAFIGWLVALMCFLGWKTEAYLVKRLFRYWDESLAVNRHLVTEIVRSQKTIREIIQTFQEDDGENEGWKNN